MVEKEDLLHLWFELSYAQYLTIPRSVLQAMPIEWKNKFAELLKELDRTIDWRPQSGRYWCRLKDSNGKFATDKFMNYRQPIKMPFFTKEGE